MGGCPYSVTPGPWCDKAILVRTLVPNVPRKAAVALFLHTKRAVHNCTALPYCVLYSLERPYSVRSLGAIARLTTFGKEKKLLFSAPESRRHSKRDVPQMKYGRFHVEGACIWWYTMERGRVLPAALTGPASSRDMFMRDIRPGSLRSGTVPVIC